MVTELRQVRAAYDAETITVYQAYSPAIADAALAAGRFVPPFRLDRMSWIKPSFFWMMYRSGWATKPGQERVLAIAVHRPHFDAALATACLSHRSPGSGETAAQWSERVAAADVVVQWDPERGPALERLDHRAIQIGLRGATLAAYASDWIATITEVTQRARELHDLLRRSGPEAVAAAMPVEPPYPLPAAAAVVVAAS